jgi:hypothetical protein
MSLLNYEHFDLYGTVLANLVLRGYVAVSGAIGTGTVRTGGAVWTVGQAGGANASLTFPLPGAARTVCGQGCALRIQNAVNTATDASNNPGIYFGDAASIFAIRCIVNQNNTITVYQGTTLRGTSAPNVITAGTWFWIEGKVITGSGVAGAGSVEVRINGVSILTVTGLTIASNITRCAIGTAGANSGWSNMFVDDWIIWDTAGSQNNDWFGDTFVLVSAPESDGATSDWVPSTGTTRWPLIDETTPLDTDFITGNAVNDTQECNTAAVSLPAGGSVVAVASQARALKTDAGASSISLGVASVASNNSGPDIALGTGASVRSHIAELNPDGNIAWTVSTAQAARFRVRRTA